MVMPPRLPVVNAKLKAFIPRPWKWKWKGI